MGDIKHDWETQRRELLESLQESLSFFSNTEKLNREKWVARKLLCALAIEFDQEEIVAAAEPADVAFRDARFQIKELYNQGRKRTDEFKRKVELARSAQEYTELVEHYDPIEISFSNVAQYCFDYAEQLTSRVKYGPLECQYLDLICYFNWIDHTVVPPIEIFPKKVNFRSLSVVSNRYCAVLYTSQYAPELLKTDTGKAIEYIQS